MSGAPFDRILYVYLGRDVGPIEKTRYIDIMLSF
jgi:hypothetical protein